jgi:hypothetical protein
LIFLFEKYTEPVEMVKKMVMGMIKGYPDFSEIDIDMRPILDPIFRGLKDGISEFTFANIYLFRKAHSYRISSLESGHFVISGSEKRGSFFMLPFGIPPDEILGELFQNFDFMKAVSESQVPYLSEKGYMIEEDRDNFDYVYLKSDLVNLSGRKFHRKKNLVNLFLRSYRYNAKPLTVEYVGDAIEVLEEWRKTQSEEGDYEAAREALMMMEELVLCGGIYYIEGKPAGYTLGEEIAGGSTYVIHFEKALGSYKGLYQFINMSFASILPQKYLYINREQDLGDEGLRQAKLSYNPVSFIKKYRATIKK